MIIILKFIKPTFKAKNYNQQKNVLRRTFWLSPGLCGLFKSFNFKNPIDLKDQPLYQAEQESYKNQAGESDYFYVDHKGLEGAEALRHQTMTNILCKPFCLFFLLNLMNTLVSSV